jgi:DNA-binding winged helix-turn-helix (wHTH) protein/tetratricopeptide (TPR) repeat protein
MAISNTSPSGRDAYIFGPFELRLRAGVLLRKGKPVRVQALPLQMLLVLLENQGQLVTRQTLQARLWGKETFVEVENGLHVVAGKLREALGDRAINPLFIKTVSGRGYCFIGEVTSVFDDAGKSLEMATVPAPTLIQAAPLLTLSVSTPEVSGSRTIRPAWRWAVAGMLAVVVCVCAVLMIYRYAQRPLASDQDRVVVGGFVNSTGNSDLDGTLTSAVQLKLQESPYLSMIPYQRFRSLVKAPDSASLKEELQACSALDGQLLIKGQIAGLKTGYQILLMAWSCANGRLLTTQKADADAQSGILSALDLATERMRRRLGESESSLQKFNVPLMQATTASLTALKAFTLGEEKRSEGMQAESIVSYKLAVDLDPQFALAYARLGNVYTNTGQASLGRECYRKAFELRNRTTDRERLYIITHYYAYSTGEIRRATADYELWLTLYPRDLVPTNNLAASYLEIGTEVQKALQLAHKAMEIDPTNKLSYAMLGQAELKAGEYANVNALCGDPERAKNDFLGFHEVCFQAAFAQGDDAGMQRQMQWAHGNPEESEMLNDAALVALYRGKMGEARQLFSEAKQTALRNNFVELATDIQVKKAGFEADFGLVREAREDALDALENASGNASEQAFGALALARSGDTVRAEVEAKAAASLAPLDTILNSALLASVRAAVQLQRQDPKAAIQSLDEARAFDFCDSMRLAPGYYRGLAYLQDNQPRLAIIEFQRVIEHRSMADYPLYVVLSQLELGRAYQLAGDGKNAERVYGELMLTWKDADSGFPPLRQLLTYESEIAR